MESQNKQILTYLQRGKSITPLDALDRFRCMRLGARIYDLKKSGHHINSQFVDVGQTKKVKEYWLIKPTEI